MKKTLFATFVALGLAFSGAGQAATLNFLGDVVNATKGAKTYKPDVVRGTMTCANCVGLDSGLLENTGKPPTLPNPVNATGFTGGDYSDLFEIANDGDATELAFINAVMTKLTLPTFGTMNKVTGNSGSMNFFSSAAYIFIKIGVSPDVTIIKNTGNAIMQFSWDASGQGAGLSHYVEVGSVCQVGDRDCDGNIDNPPPPPPTVPVPAAGFLLVGAMGGLAALRRRRKA